MVNINILGFKFQDLYFFEYIMEVVENMVFEILDQVMFYVDMFIICIDFEFGFIKMIGNDMDFVFNSDGFFVVQLFDGMEVYICVGLFYLNV